MVDGIPHTLSIQYPASLLVDDLSLLVHYLVVLQKVLPDSVVVELDLLLRLFDGSGKHLVLNLLPIRNAQSIEDGHQFLRSEQAKQIILQRQVKTGFSRIPLTSGTSTELIVDPPGLMPLGADDLQASGLPRFIVQLNIGTTSRHVGSDRHRSMLSGLRNNLSLQLMELRV